ncbi:HNH endonuclease signature motif containing protein [Streptomyces sp. NPDC096538]|uniref:HNH endonuclease n=1 Tax=Streptomyces sp. NPDC096538 TaxID=3155427 RepID=UPI003321C49F
MNRKRRRFRIWEWLCVLTANDGRCVYCNGPSQTMDHVISFADGGADDLCNLVPVCRACNRSKGGKTPVEWLISMDLRTRWHGGGTAQQCDVRGISLRDMYLSVHAEVLELLDDLDRVAAEIADPKRRSWFVWATYWNYPDPEHGPSFFRLLFAERIEKAKTAGWPDRRPSSLRR